MDRRGVQMVRVQAGSEGQDQNRTRVRVGVRVGEGASLERQPSRLQGSWHADFDSIRPDRSTLLMRKSTPP